MPKPLTSTKNFIVKHKTTILVTSLVVATTIVALQQVGVKQHNAFLQEKGLFNEFYEIN